MVCPPLLYGSCGATSEASSGFQHNNDARNSQNAMFCVSIEVKRVCLLSRPHKKGLQPYHQEVAAEHSEMACL